MKDYPLKLEPYFDSDGVDQIGWWTKGHFDMATMVAELIERREIGSLDDLVAVDHDHIRFVPNQDDTMSMIRYQAPGPGAIPVTIWIFPQGGVV